MGSITSMPKNWNDKCSSFKIVAGALAGPAAGEAWLYQGADYTGPCWALSAGTTVDSLKTIGANDRVRSIRLGPSTSIQVWLNEKMSGKSDVYTTSMRAFSLRLPCISFKGDPDPLIAKLLNGFSAEISSCKVDTLAAPTAPAVVTSAVRSNA